MTGCAEFGPNRFAGCRPGAFKRDLAAFARSLPAVGKRSLMTRFIAVLLVGILGWSCACMGETCSLNDHTETKYLVFWGPYPGDAPDQLDRIGPLAARLGTTGDGKRRQLGFGPGIPFWTGQQVLVREAIRQAFDTAKRTNVAADFLIDDHIGWDVRPDLWNWYDPAKPGYNPENRKNVEWYDWEGTPNKRRYFTPEGTPSQSPHMCYNSPEVEKAISRIVSDIVGPALREAIDGLKKENKAYLFAGITIGQEAGFDDYSKIPKLSDIPRANDPFHSQWRMTLTQAATLMDEDKAPHRRLGYCSLANAGYSRANPPNDFNHALAEINQKFIEFWDKQFVEAGIPCSKIYTHVAASVRQDGDNNAPIWSAFNRYARPGWTTYPVSTLGNGFQPLYDALDKQGDPAWAGVEANAAMALRGESIMPGWEKYLAWHYNHGAKLVGINSGATDTSLMSHLSKGAFGDEALTAYRKFLNGQPLDEK